MGKIDGRNVQQSKVWKLSESKFQRENKLEILLHVLGTGITSGILEIDNFPTSCLPNG